MASIEKALVPDLSGRQLDRFARWQVDEPVTVGVTQRLQTNDGNLRSPVRAGETPSVDIYKTQLPEDGEIIET